MWNQFLVFSLHNIESLRNITNSMEIFSQNRMDDEVDIGEVWMVFKDLVSCLEGSSQWRDKDSFNFI